jgi:hypothetical protein
MVIIFFDRNRESNEKYDKYASDLVTDSVRAALLNVKSCEITSQDSVFSYPGCFEKKLERRVKEL